MPNFRAALIAALTCFVGFESIAQTVILSDPSGATLLEGDVIHSDENIIELDSKYGPITINTPTLDCSGACPSQDAEQRIIKIASDASIVDTLLSLQIEAFAARTNITISLDGQRYVFETDPPLTIDISSTSSEDAIGSLISGSADIAISLRPVDEEETKQLRPSVYGQVKPALRSQIIALDALAPVTSLDNTVTVIKDINLLEILDGKITNWRDLGGADREISVLPVSQDLASLIENFGIIANTSSRQTYNDQTGYFGIVPFSKSYGEQVMQLNGPCGYSPVLHRRSVKTEDYALSLPIIAYFAPKPLPNLIQELFDFMSSPSGNLITQRAGYFDPSIEEIPLDVQGKRLATAIQGIDIGADLATVQDMASLMSKTVRLSTTFRFDAGATELNTVSRAHLLSLARDLQKGRYLDRTLYLVGFSDGNGPAAINLDLSLKRAETVLKSLRAHIPEADRERHSIEAVGFGEALPIDCDDQIIGREVNRRVEVWIE